MVDKLIFLLLQVKPSSPEVHEEKTLITTLCTGFCPRALSRLEEEMRSNGIKTFFVQAEKQGAESPFVNPVSVLNLCCWSPAWLLHIRVLCAGASVAKL